MTAPRKHYVGGQPHIQPAPRPRPKIKDVAAAQQNHVNRAKPPTIDTPPWERTGQMADTAASYAALSALEAGK